MDTRNHSGIGVVGLVGRFPELRLNKTKLIGTVSVKLIEAKIANISESRYFIYIVPLCVQSNKLTLIVGTFIYNCNMFFKSRNGNSSKYLHSAGINKQSRFDCVKTWERWHCRSLPLQRRSLSRRLRARLMSAAREALNTARGTNACLNSLKLIKKCTTYSLICTFMVHVLYHCNHRPTL